MARPRKPVGLLLLTGTGKTNPGRLKGRAEKRADGTWEETVAAEAGLGAPPDYLGESERARWADLIEIVPAGILTKMDRPAAELLCKLWAESRRGTLAASREKLLVSLFGKFGLTPSERSKVGGLGRRDPKKPENPFRRLG